MNHKEIGGAVRQLDRERRKKMEELMRQYDQESYHPKRIALQKQCGELGHNWVFTHLGPLSDPWFSCTICGASECRIKRDD